MIDDDVCGTIIGSVCITGRLYFNGRPQGGQIHADNEADLLVKASNQKIWLNIECGGAAPLIYPSKGVWELRIYL